MDLVSDEWAKEALETGKGGVYSKVSIYYQPLPTTTKPAQ